jgi:integrase
VPGQDAPRPKRPNGAGSEWFDAKRAMWFATYTRGLRPDGVPEVKRFASKVSAEEAARKRDEDRARWLAHTVPAAPVELQTLGRFLRRRWLPSLKRGPETLRRYERDVRLHIDPARPTPTSIGHVRLRALSPAHLQRLYDALPPSVASNVHALLHVALKRATRWGDLPRDANPADLVDPPVYAAPEMHPPKEEQVAHFFASCLERDDPWLDLWFFLADTGCRPGEMLGAEWADIDAGGEWFVQRQRRTTGKPQKAVLKNKLRRRVQLTERLMARLEQRRERQAALRERAGGYWTEEGLIFANRLGGAFQWGNVSPEFRAALRAAGLPSWPPYVFFRHAHVTIGLGFGVSLQAMARRTGHSVEVMARVYAHRSARADREAAAAFERATRPG